MTSVESCQFSVVRIETWEPGGIPGRHRAGAEGAAEKGLITSKDSEKRCSGTEARADSAGFMRGLKPPPPSEVSFSAVCLTAKEASMGRDSSYSSGSFGSGGNTRSRSTRRSVDATTSIRRRIGSSITTSPACGMRPSTSLTRPPSVVAS